MTPRLKKVYDIAKKDSDYCSDMESTDGNHVPGFFAEDIDKIAFAAMYSGYILKKLGVDGYNRWRSSL